jgi:hypothetical protein
MPAPDPPTSTPAAPSGALTSSIKATGSGPWRLQISDGNLMIRDGSCRATWIAPVQCLYGNSLRPWDQCGGTTCSPTANALGEPRGLAPGLGRSCGAGP